MSMREFNSLEEMQAYMRRQEAAANARVTPEQAQIGYGAFWLRLYEDLLIFGYVPTQDEIEASERALGADDGEIAFQQASMADSFARGHRYGKCYSVVEPDGEWGSTHIATMIPITKEQFDHARAQGWDPVELLLGEAGWVRDVLIEHGLI